MQEILTVHVDADGRNLVTLHEAGKSPITVEFPDSLMPFVCALLNVLAGQHKVHSVDPQGEVWGGYPDGYKDRP